jgi:hypothetical protein
LLYRSNVKPCQRRNRFGTITRGNFRLMERLFVQMKRIMALNRVEEVSCEVVDAARDCLVIGPETDNYREQKAANYL